MFHVFIILWLYLPVVEHVPVTEKIKKRAWEWSWSTPNGACQNLNCKGPSLTKAFRHTKGILWQSGSLNKTIYLYSLQELLSWVYSRLLFFIFLYLEKMFSFCLFVPLLWDILRLACNLQQYFTNSRHQTTVIEGYYDSIIVIYR